MEPNQNPTKPTIADLIKLLDPDTLNLLTERLHAAAVVQEEAPEQLLFAFIDEGLSLHEEEPEDKRTQAALRAFFNELYSK